MAKKLRLLLLDANIIIELFRLGLWDQFLECCDVHLARTVVAESRFYEDDEGRLHGIDLLPFETRGQLTVFDVSLAQDRQLTQHFDLTYLERFDPGEREALAHLVTSTDPYVICSADRIVFNVLGFLDRADQGVSLEELLQKAGLARTMSWQYTRAFRDKYTNEGFVDHLQKP